MMIHDINEAVSILEKKHDWTTGDITLDNFKRYVEYKKNPQYSLKCIHISGTNGKGSTSKALALMLEEAGYKVGTFNSPSILKHVDQIQVNGNSICESKYLEYVNSYYEEFDEYNLSLFEVDVFISILYFIEQEVDFVIYEVGMGGELDATNVIYSILSCITNIGMDHCSFLGSTYSEIAQTKAGIIKENSCFITGEKKKECLEVFERMCRQKNTKLKMMFEPTDIKIDSSLHFDTALYKDVEVSTVSIYQAQNVALAIGMLHALQEERYIQYKDEDVYSALKKFNWIGRFEVVQKDPYIILDGAHNREGIDALVNACKVFNRLSIIFSALKDKPYEYMLDQLETISDDITICAFNYYRAESVENLTKNRNVKVASDYKEAIEMNKGKDLLICGSLYFIQQVRKYIFEKK